MCDPLGMDELQQRGIPWTRETILTADPTVRGTYAYAAAVTYFHLQDEIEVRKQSAIAEYNVQFDKYQQNKDNNPTYFYPEPVPAKVNVITWNEWGMPGMDVGTEEVCPRRTLRPPAPPTANPAGYGNNIFGLMEGKAAGPSAPVNATEQAVEALGLYQSVKLPSGKVVQRIG